jgi:hypothetical protein
MNTEFLPNELPLNDDYPVYWDYVYLADGKMIRSNIQGTVRELKRYTKAKEIRNCDIITRRKQLLK